MASDWEESRSERHDRAGFEGRQARVTSKPQPTDSASSGRLPIDFAIRLARAIVSAGKMLGRQQPDEGWPELLAKRAWPFSLLLAFWYLLRSNRDLSALPAIRVLTAPPSFFFIFRLFDSQKDLLERPAQVAYDATTPASEPDAAEAFRFAASRLGASSLRAAVSNSFFQEVSDLLGKKVPAPASLSSTADTKGSTSRNAGSADVSAAARVKASAPAVAASARRKASVPTEPAEKPSTALAVSAPNLTSREQCMILLIANGHSQADAERICAGPAAMQSGEAVPLITDANRATFEKSIAQRAVADGLGKFLKEASSKRRPLLAMVSATWCGPCQLFKRAMQEKPELARELRKFVFADFDTDRSAGAEEVGAALKVTSYPTFVVLSADGTERGRIVGFRDAPGFASWLRTFSEPRVA